jgi:hypothetical protein
MEVSGQLHKYEKDTERYGSSMEKFHTPILQQQKQTYDKYHTRTGEGQISL